jgi:GNAT superfamily N-acetyltransferase
MVALLADRLDLIEPAGDLRWREWGRPPEPVDRSWWIDVTRREAGRHDLPVSWVAVGSDGDLAGTVGLGEFDIEERRDTSPWVMGLVVREDLRGKGIGRLLMQQLERHAIDLGYPRMWVATGQAVGFYQRCGYQIVERLTLANGLPSTVLAKPLDHRPA